ncbi:MAG: hypothetical protein K2Y14_01080 [Burkholderiales bacterium]|nr:hypothetical protein [Burkholderiales bacterium]
MKNITIIGSTRPSVPIVNHYTLKDVMDQVRIRQLNKFCKKEYLNFWSDELNYCIKYNSEHYKRNLERIVKDYTRQNSEDKLSEIADIALTTIKEEWLARFWSNEEPKNIISDGVNWIEVKSHVCNDHIALILPYLINSIKDFEKPILMCSEFFITNYYDCDDDENRKFYKISEQFYTLCRRDCSELGILFIEYTGTDSMNYIL